MINVDPYPMTKAPFLILTACSACEPNESKNIYILLSMSLPWTQWVDPLSSKSSQLLLKTVLFSLHCFRDLSQRGGYVSTIKRPKGGMSEAERKVSLLLLFCVWFCFGFVFFSLECCQWYWKDMKHRGWWKEWFFTRERKLMALGCLWLAWIHVVSTTSLCLSVFPFLSQSWLSIGNV